MKRLLVFSAVLLTALIGTWFYVSENFVIRLQPGQTPIQWPFGYGPMFVVDYGSLMLPTPVIGGEAQNQFFDEVIKVDKVVDVNVGITMERTVYGDQPYGSPTPSPTFICFAVYNHLNEDIFFNGRDFDLRIFAYIPGEGWQQLDNPDNQQAIVLPGKLEKFLPELDNSWCTTWLTVPEQYKEIRLYISGETTANHWRYGAYLDATIAP